MKERLNENSAIDKYNLQETGVPNIDSMLTYMRSEALSKNIEFELKISGDISYMVNNIIDKQDLEIMIADHIKDGIIAIKSKHSETNRKLLIKLGKFEDYFEFSVSDTGIDFEINTLIKLGLERVTTHEDIGGSGIGFMTTFETLKTCRASLIIEEYHPSDIGYSKTVMIRFDNKNEYRIKSYRAKEIKLFDINKRILLD